MPDILRPVGAPHRSAWLRACLVVFATAVAALAATGVAPVGAQTPPLRVAMVGDSVMLGARDQLLAQFAGMPVTVDAIEDRSLLGAIGMFQSAGPALGDVVVLDLGYNDSSDPTVFRERIDGAMAALAGVKHVIWLNQHEFRPDRAGMNAELNAAASRYANLEVVDWNAEVVAHPGGRLRGLDPPDARGAGRDGGARPPALRPLRHVPDADDHRRTGDDHPQRLDAPAGVAAGRPRRRGRRLGHRPGHGRRGRGGGRGASCSSWSRWSPVGVVA